MVQRLKGQTRNYQTYRKRVVQKLYDSRFGHDFLTMTPKSLEKKNRQTGLHGKHFKSALKRQHGLSVPCLKRSGWVLYVVRAWSLDGWFIDFNLKIMLKRFQNSLASDVVTRTLYSTDRAKATQQTGRYHLKNDG